MLKKSVFMKKYFLDEKHAFISRAIELIALSAHKIRFIAKKVSLVITLTFSVYVSTPVRTFWQSLLIILFTSWKLSAALTSVKTYATI